MKINTEKQKKKTSRKRIWKWNKYRLEIAKLYHMNKYVDG